MRAVPRLAVAALTGAVLWAGASAVAGGADDGGRRPLGPGLVTVEVDIDHSRFSVERLRVRQGTVVRFLVRNADPITHELVVGDEDVHDRHRRGAEGRHPPVPGEVVARPGEVAHTFFEFDSPGTVVFACHLPGHVAYGMVGEVEVVDGSSGKGGGPG